MVVIVVERLVIMKIVIMCKLILFVLTLRPDFFCAVLLRPVNLAASVLASFTACLTSFCV